MQRWSFRRRSLSWETSFDWSEMEICALPGVSSHPAVRNRPGFQIKWTQPIFHDFMRTIHAAENRGDEFCEKERKISGLPPFLSEWLILSKTLENTRLTLFVSEKRKWFFQFSHTFLKNTSEGTMIREKVERKFLRPTTKLLWTSLVQFKLSDNFS